jgi:hypothetical protein
MITNDSELEIARQNLANIDAAIESLRKELLPSHEQNFNLYAQPWLDFKNQFEAEIEAYLSVTRPKPDATLVPNDAAESPPAHRV